MFMRMIVLKSKFVMSKIQVLLLEGGGPREGREGVCR